MSANYNISTFLYDYWWFTSFMEQKDSISCSNSILKEKLCFQMIMKKMLTHFILLEQNRALLFSSSSNPKSHCKTIRWMTKKPLFDCLCDYHVPPSQSTPHLENRIEITYIYRNNIQIQVITNHIKKRTYCAWSFRPKAWNIFPAKLKYK